MKMSSGSVNNVGSFAETLSTIVKEHCEQFMRQKDEENARLRTEVIQLQDELTRVNQDFASSKNCIAGKDMGVLEEAQTNAVQKRGDMKEFADAGKNLWSTITAAASVASIATQKTSSVTDAPTHLENEPNDFSPRSVSHASKMSPMEDLRTEFSDLDPHGTGYIELSGIVDSLTHNITSQQKRDEQRHSYVHAVHKVNKSFGIYAHRLHGKKNTRDGIPFATFEVIMVEEITILRKKFGKDVAKALLEIREHMISEIILKKAAHRFAVHKDDLADLRQAEKKRSKIHKYLEPLVGCMVLLNALLIGVRVDTNPDWNGWFVVECFFSGFFLIEFLCHISIVGCIEHFFGSDWKMNWFDFLIVGFAIADSFLTMLDKLQITDDEHAGSYYLLLLRLVRLMRVSRILRVLRLKVFQELALIVNGVINGLRTLFWAIVLLTFFMYVVGVFMRQLINPEHSTFQCEENSTGNSQTCNRGEQNLDEYGAMMFGSVVRSMLTMFNCFTDGCASPDGTPLIWHLWDAHGQLLVIGYYSCFVFVSFGLFNLIMAVMVQNTMEHAAQLERARQFGDMSALTKKAHKLHRLLIKLCTASASSKVVSKSSHPRRSFKHFFAKIWDGMKKDSNKEPPDFMQWEDSRHLHLQVNQDQFDEIMRDKDVGEFLDDLDISAGSRANLFDILDADGSGVVSISELVEGLMKLRGPCDKGDAIATELCLRQVQKQVGKLEHLFEELMQSQGGTSNANDEKHVPARSIILI